MRKFLIIAISIITLLIIITTASFFYIANKTSINQLPPIQSPSDSTTCEALGCNSDAIYAGSINSDKYYTCDCHYANRIKEENIICFTSDEEATEKGYEKIDC
jgi:hypothetical protein